MSTGAVKSRCEPGTEKISYESKFLPRDNIEPQ